MEITEVIKLLPKVSDDERALLLRAFSFANNVHGEHKRLSGEPYIIHSLETAKTLADLHLDLPTIIAGLLHDTIGEAGVTREKIAAEFGEDVAFLVDEQQKLDRIRYQGSEKYAENLRKLLVVTAKDVRVLIIRLAHRLHNVKTLMHVPKEKHGRIALETLEIYAPIANRLGMGNLKDALETAAFPFAYPTEYELTKELLEKKAPRAKENLEQVYAEILRACTEHHLKHIRIEYRVKQIYSVYKKLVQYDLDIDKIYDIAALRIITPSVADCYQVLGLIHSMWRPVPGRIKDYIALPKPNGYQSIHTSVFTNEGTVAEFQIRTEEMNREAEFGIVSHIAYTESGKPKSGGIISKKLAWVKQLLEWQQHFSGSQDMLENLRTDFFQKRIFAFTPKGDVIELPDSATPIDFAYAIHSDIGNKTFGAKVNGKLVALDTKLKNGDIIEIITKKNAKPSPKWLEFAATALARKHIRSETHTSAVAPLKNKERLALERTQQEDLGRA